MSTSRAAQVERSPTRILRDKGIDPSIKCTSTLVANYNAEEDANVRKAMRIWLDTHIKEFSKISTGSISRNTITEFMNLAETKVKQPADAELVRRVYTTLSEVVMTKEGCSVYFVLALEHVLSIIDKEILQGDANALIALADRLIEMTDPKKTALTRDTFEHHASCLHAFERVLMVLHDLEKGRSNNHIVKYFEDKTKKHLDMIISCQCYYPFAYQALLIKEHLKALVHRDIKSNLINAGRRAFYAVCGGLYIFQGVRELAVMKLDFNVMVSGLEKIQQAFKDIGLDTMPGVQEIVLAASETVRQEEFGIFQQCYDKYKTVSWLEGLKRSKQRAIRYALVSHLCLFCTENHSPSIQAPALQLSVKLVSEDEGKQWRNDLHIFEGMIDALIAIGKQNQVFEENVVNAFNAIVRVQTKQQKKIIDECLNGMPFKEKIKCHYKPDDDDASRSLFHSTRKRLNLCRTASVCNRNQQTLKDYYTTNSFSKVSLFADEFDQRHIKAFDFNLKEYEKIVVSQGGVGEFSQGAYNQRENNLRRTTFVKKPISMMELFKKHQKTECGLHEEIQRVLVIGNPGTGKTCLSKRICHDWATSTWGLGFAHVYLLPIRRLYDDRIGNCGDLASMILQLIYHVEATQALNQPLYEEVRDNLSKASTLLILDGYDEAGDTAKDMVSSALTFGCCLLILSRPHSVQEIRPSVNNEVECLEFSKEQLRTFVRKELVFCDANDLLEFLSKHVSIEATCLVAVNAHIITKLWTSSYKEELVKSHCANLSNFYRMISKYLWTRFTEKEDKYDIAKTFDSLERIAFEAFQKGQVEIPEPLILEHAQESRKVFCASGFLLFVKEGFVFQFAHLTFHEYFAGCHLAKLLKSNDDEERQEAVDFIIEHRYIETSRVMLSFMTQQFCMRKDIGKTLEAFEDLMQVLNSDPMPSISLQHLLLRMRILDAFLPCGLGKTEVYTNDDVMLIVNDATDALKHWFGYELNDDDSRIRPIIKKEDLRTPIADELERMPNLFNRFPDLLKPVLLNDYAKSDFEDEYHLDIARIGKLNPQYARQCIVPLLDNWTTQEQAIMIHLCTLIGPVCADPTLDHLKKLLVVRDYYTLEMATESLGKFLELFPKREDVRQLVLNASRDLNVDMRRTLVYRLGFITFTPEDKAGTLVWDLLNEAMKDDNGELWGEALRSCVRLYQTFGKSVDEVMEFIREFMVSSDFDNDFKYASLAIEALIEKAREKEEELLALMKVVCKDSKEYVRSFAVKSLLRILKRSCLKREVLFNVAFDIFKDGYPNVQYNLLPFIFSFDKEGEGIDQVSEWIANCQDINKEVRKKANSCREANALLSNYTIEEIHKKFDDQDKKVQMEVVAQFDLRELASNKMVGAIAKMAAHCLRYYKFFETSISLLDKLSKTELFPSVLLKKMIRIRDPDSKCVRKQPLSHLLQYYWNTKDSNVIPFIIEKLLLSSVIFEKKGITKMEVTFREKGANVTQIAPVEVVEELLSRCNAHLKKWYGLDFLHDDAFYSDEESDSDEAFDSDEEFDFSEESESD